MSLHEELTRDPSDLHWRCGHEEARGAAVLRIARPGLLLVGADEMVPRPAFHRWMFDGAERLLKAHVEFGDLEDHVTDWLGHGIAMIARPMEPTEEMRGLVLMSMASLNTYAAIRSGSGEMGNVYAWTCNALSWAAKRVLGDRRCPHDPVSLNEELVELHASFARFAGDDLDEARSMERRAQVSGLIDAWKAAQ